MPGWVWWIIWGVLALGALVTYAVIGLGLADRIARIIKHLEKVSGAAEKLGEAARLLDRNN